MLTKLALAELTNKCCLTIETFESAEMSILPKYKPSTLNPPKCGPPKYGGY